MGVILTTGSKWDDPPGASQKVLWSVPQTALYIGPTGLRNSVLWRLPPTVQWLFLVPLKGGRWHVIPQLAVYTTYIPLIVLAFWWVICYLPPLGEPETTIELCFTFISQTSSWSQSCVNCCHVSRLTKSWVAERNPSCRTAVGVFFGLMAYPAGDELNSPITVSQIFLPYC